MNTTILVVCVVLVTVAFVALAVQAIITLRQIRYTAKAVEYLALNADGKLTALDPMMDAAQTVASAVSSGWFKIAQTVFGFFSKK